MIQTNLYIPKTITVGFKPLNDGKLGYVIYTDDTGKLRKEPSWQAWRDMNIEPICVLNNPRSEFTLNKSVQRNGHWGGGRQLVRVWDALDFEIELSIDNLIGLLNHATINDRVIKQECVYAWQGTELVLLPTNSEAYQYALTHTDKQANSISAKNMKVGYTYKVKKDNSTVLYLGYFSKYVKEVTERYVNQQYIPTIISQHKAPRKVHWFATVDNVSFVAALGYEDIFSRSSADFLSSIETEYPIVEYNKLLKSMHQMVESQPFNGLTIEHRSNGNNDWVQLNTDTFMQFGFRSGSTLLGNIFILRIAQYQPITNTIVQTVIQKVWDIELKVHKVQAMAIVSTLQTAYNEFQPLYNPTDAYQPNSKFPAYLNSIGVTVGVLCQDRKSVV